MSCLCRASRVGHRSQEPSTLVAFRNFEEEMRNPGVWEPEQGAASTAETSRDNLASLYRPPFHLMFNGPFDKVNMLLRLDFPDSVGVERVKPNTMWREFKKHTLVLC